MLCKFTEHGIRGPGETTWVGTLSRWLSSPGRKGGRVMGKPSQVGGKNGVKWEGGGAALVSPQGPAGPGDEVPFAGKPALVGTARHAATPRHGSDRLGSVPSVPERRPHPTVLPVLRRALYSQHAESHPTPLGRTEKSRE